MDAAFSQLSVLGSSAMLLCGFIVLWRRGVPAYISAFTAQSMALAGVMAVVAHFGRRPDLYWVAGVALAPQGGRDPLAAPAHGAAVRAPSASSSPT